MMLYGVINPVLTAPSVKIVLDENVTTLVAGREVSLTGELVFDRGSISPAYGTSGYRAGEENEYRVNGIFYPTPRFELTIVPKVGENTIRAQVSFDAGEQPLNSIGQPFDSPLAEGTVEAALVLEAVAPVYDQGGDEVEFEYFAEEDGSSGYEAMLAAETTGEQQRQSFAIAESVKVIGVKQFNPMSNQWEWLGGDAENSLEYFDTTVISAEELGSKEDYVLYVNNDLPTGERELRIYTTKEADK